MIYKIEFDPKKAEWALFVNNLLIWRRVKTPGFKTYQEAEEYVQTTGFDNAYVRKNYRQHLRNLETQGQAMVARDPYNYGGFEPSKSMTFPPLEGATR